MMTDDKNEFSGDVLMESTGDGGDIVVSDGLVMGCHDFTTAALLSLFGGNKDDTDGRPKETWWGNLVPGTKKNERMQSELGSMVEGIALTSGNLRKAAKAAERDLDWIKSDAGADDVSVSLAALTLSVAALTAEIVSDGQRAGGGTYELQWQEAVR